MFGTLGSCTRALHIVGKTTYFARARCERASSMWMPREHYTIGELAWWCRPASYPSLPATNIRVSDASVAKSRTPLPHTQHQGEAPHSCAIVCFVLSSHPKIVNRGFCWAYKNEIIYYYKIAEMKSLYKAKQNKAKNNNFVHRMLHFHKCCFPNICVTGGKFPSTAGLWKKVNV